MFQLDWIRRLGSSMRGRAYEYLGGPVQVQMFDKTWVGATDGHGLILVKDDALPAMKVNDRTQKSYGVVLKHWQDGRPVKYSRLCELLSLDLSLPDCPECWNAGYVMCQKCDGEGEWQCVCSDCDNDHQAQCRKCDGRGEIECACAHERLSRGDDPCVIDGIPFNRNLIRRFLGMLRANEVLVGVNKEQSMLSIAESSGSWRVQIMGMRMDTDGLPVFDIAA